MFYEYIQMVHNNFGGLLNEKKNKNIYMHYGHCLLTEWKHLLSLQVLSKKKLQDLVREIDPNEQLDEDVEEVCQWF